MQVKQAEAYQLGETRKREAEAAVQEAQNRAMAKAALAQAERVEAERRAAVEAPAKAEKARIIVEAEAEAEKRRIEAEGQAAAIFAKLDAEARGQYEILAKKGEGLRRIIEACGGSQQAFQLLMLEHLDTLAQTAAQAISNIKFDKVIVWEGGNGANGNGSATRLSFLQSMARTHAADDADPEGHRRRRAAGVYCQANPRIGRWPSPRQADPCPGTDDRKVKQPAAGS